MRIEEFREFWAAIVERLLLNKAPAKIIDDALSQQVHIHCNRDEYRLFCSSDLAEYLERNLDKFKPIYCKYLDNGSGVKLIYVVK